MASKTFLKLKNDFSFSSPVFRHAVRAAVAITAAIAAGKNLSLSHGVWIPISVIVVMRPSLGGTLQISWKRFAGTLAGAAVGVLILCLNLSVITVCFLVSLSSFFIFYYKTKNFIAFTATLTLAVVLILGTVFSHSWQGGMERVLDTFLGIAFGVGASFLIWPNFARKNLRKEMGGLIKSQHEHFKQLRHAYIHGAENSASLLTGRREAAQRLEICSEKFKDASIEPGLRTNQRQELLNLTDIFTRIHGILTALSSIVNKSPGGLHENVREKLEELMDAIEEQFVILETYAHKGIILTRKKEFPVAFNEFMTDLGKMRAMGEFENLTLDRRNNSSAFISHINRLGIELIRAGKSIETIRKAQ